MSGSEPPPPPVKPPVKRPTPAAGAPVAATPAPAPLRASLCPDASPVTRAAPARQLPPSPRQPAAGARPAPASPCATSRGSPPRRAAASAAGGAAPDRYRNALEIFRAGDLDGAAVIWESLLAEEHRGGFTVQLLTACQHDTIRDAQRSLAAQELYLVTKK